jgi:uncharacterized protein YcfJ
MMNQRTTAGLTTVALLLGLANPVLAGGHGHGRAGPVYAYAQVISSQPIVRYVTVRTPVEECWEDVEYYTVDRRPAGEGARTFAGAVIGGVIGHQFGSGSGNDAATIAGTLIGATIGNQSTYRNAPGSYGPTQYSRPVTRCETRYRNRQEKRIDGYNVVYRYHGQKYATRMPHDPGQKIRVRVDIRPAG